MDRSPVRGVARLAAILDSLPEALLLIDGGGRVVNANAVAVGWFEAPGTPLVGRPITDLLSGFGTAVARIPDHQSGGMWTETGAAEGPGGGEPERMVAKYADGSGFPAEVVRSFLPPAHGGLEVVLVRNVSGIADAEQELRRQQRQTELILRAASEGIVGVDTAGRVVLVNPAAARILKYRASELGGMEFESLVTGPAAGEPSPVADTLRTGRKHRLGTEAALHLAAKDGTSVPVELSTAPVLEGEALVGAVVTFVDVSRFRVPAVVGAAGRQGAQNGALNTESLSALRRPLDAARGELSRLAGFGEGLSPSARHHLAHVTAELAEAARLVDDLLDAATGLSGFRKRPAELGRIVHAAVDAATDLAAAAGIDLAVHTGPAEVVIDAERLTQAVRHLVVDTVQASPRGSTVVVAAARRGVIARIEVRGIEIGSVPEHLGFARVVVERHGGQLSVHRVEGKGVTYVIELPVGPEGETELASGAPAATRNLVEETRIIPIVREIEAPEPVTAGAGASAGSGGRRRIEGQPAPTIPRQAPAIESNWFEDTGEFDGVRGYAMSEPVAPATPAKSVTPPAPAVAVPEPEATPRGRRRAGGQPASAQPLAQTSAGAYQGADGGYLIQHVEPGRPVEPEPPGSLYGSPAQAGSGTDAAASASLYGGSPSGSGADAAASVLFGGGPLPSSGAEATVTGPLFRDEVPQQLGPETSVYGSPAGYGAEPAQPQQPYQAEPAPHSPFDTMPRSPLTPSALASEPRAWPNPDEPDPVPDLSATSESLQSWPPPGGGAPASAPVLLVWPAPEPNSAQLLQAQGYAPTALKAPAQFQEPGPLRPVALLADPVGVPVTRAALHTLRAAAADSGIPLFVSAGLGAVHAASLAAPGRRGADPSVLLRALTPEQVSAPRVLLIEENPDLAAAFAISLERDGMRVVQASTENDAMSSLSAEHPQLVVMNLTLVRRRRSGVVDWLRAYERLHLAPTVVYTVPPALTGDVDLMRALRSGAAAVHLTDRETGPEAANRLLDLMGKVAD